jgi:hypothetical protein
MYASSRVPRAAAINATACSSVSDFDGRPPSCPFGGFTSAATFRPTRSSRSACRIARTSTLCAICTVRVDRPDAMLASAFCAAPAVSLVSSTVPSSSRSAFAIVLRYTVTVAGASPSSQSSSASFTV